MQAVFVYITAPGGLARSLARRLVRDRLCASANVIPGMESFYWWKGKLENGAESIIICKTTKEAYPALEQRVRDLHPYETPCIAALPVLTAFPPFMQWIGEETRS